MRIRKAFAALVVIGILLAPLTAAATDWEEWKFLLRHRPVAVFFAIPPLIVTSPFMGAKWLLSDHSDEDAEHEDEDEDDE